MVVNSRREVKVKGGTHSVLGTAQASISINIVLPIPRSF